MTFIYSFIYLFIVRACVCAHMYGAHVHTPWQSMWRSENNLWESVLSFSTCGFSGSNLGHQAWWRQVPLPTELCHQARDSRKLLRSNVSISQAVLQNRMVGDTAELILHNLHYPDSKIRWRHSKKLTNKRELLTKFRDGQQIQNISRQHLRTKVKHTLGRSNSMIESVHPRKARLLHRSINIIHYINKLKV